MEQISLGQVYDILCRATVNDESICYLCLMSVSPIAKQHAIAAAILKRIEIYNYDVISLYRNTAQGKGKIAKYLDEEVVDVDSRCLKAKLQKLKKAYDDYEQVSWRDFRVKMQKRQYIIELRNQNIPAEYIFDAAYNYFAKQSTTPRQLMREKLMDFVK